MSSAASDTTPLLSGVTTKAGCGRQGDHGGHNDHELPHDDHAAQLSDRLQHMDSNHRGDDQAPSEMRVRVAVGI